MATLAQVARERKNQLGSLLKASLKLDASQELLEREVKRLRARKKAVPELADATRLANMCVQVDTSLQNLIGLIGSMAQSWGTQY